MAITPLKFRTITYAKTIFVYGTNRLTAREGFSGVADGYYLEVEKYGAETYTQDQITLALASGWINQQEYDEIMLLKSLNPIV